MTHTPEPAFRNLDHISSNAQDTSKLAALSARIADLEAQLYAIGAGGVGQSIKPSVQADTAQEPGAGIPASVPTGWKLVPMEPTAAMLDAAFDTEVVHTEWGVDAFVENTAEVYGAMLAAAPEAPAQQKPVAHLPCCGYADTSALKWNPYNSVAQCHNCGQVYAAPNPARQPLTDEKLYALYCEAMKGYYVSALHYWRETEAHKFARAIEAAVANQPARQPLTEDQLRDALRQCPHDTAENLRVRWLYAKDFARAVEAAHGITGGQQ